VNLLDMHLRCVPLYVSRLLSTKLSIQLILLHKLKCSFPVKTKLL
jgi:hypothetical protein